MQRKGKRFPKPNGKSIFNYFPRIVYTYGTYADGVLLHNIFKPVCANALASLFYSGSFWKITAER
jgi:hypothetical protein